jgi:hypothetical protein
MRNVVALILVIGVGVGVFMYRRGSASDEIKTQMLLIVDDMDLPAQERGEVKALVSQFHRQAFNRAMDVSKQLGRKFDEKSYYEEVFSLVVTRLREEGNTLLADNVERRHTFHSLSVKER